MVHCVKIFLNVQIDDPFIPLIQVFQNLINCHMCVSVGSESIAILTEVSLVAP